MDVTALAVVMPWLNPKDLACLALTCRALAAAAASLTSLRVNDVARGLEPFPVPVYNAVDRSRYPFFFYSPSSILGSTLPILPWGLPSHMSAKPSYFQPLGADGPASGPPSSVCPRLLSNSRSEKSNSRHCMCVSKGLEAEFLPPAKKQRQLVPLCGHLLEGELAYDSNSRLRCLTVLSESHDGVSSCDFLSIMECGPACDCSVSCKYRVTQNGLATKVAVYKDQRKGWSLQAMQPIEKGTFLFEYAGELLTTAEAQNRQRPYDGLRKMRRGFSCALLVLREHLPSGNLCLRLNMMLHKLEM